VGIAMVAISVVPAFLVLTQSVSVVQEGGYAALYERDPVTGLDVGPQVLAAFLVPGALFLLAGSRRRVPLVVLSGVVVCAYAAVELFLGARSTGIMPLLAWAWLFHRVVRRLDWRLVLAASSLILFAVFPVIRAIRDFNAAGRASTDYLAALMATDNPVVATVSEMGATMQTVAYTLELVPQTRPFDLGSSYLVSLLTAVTPHSVWEDLLQIPGGTYSGWLAAAVDPIFAARGGGFGYSFVAEAYANLSWLGPLALLVIGFAFVRFRGWAEEGADPARLAALASFLAFFLFFPRSESVTVVRPLVWYSLAPYAVVLLLRSRRRRRGAKAP
jgi:hypothetical protein